MSLLEGVVGRFGLQGLGSRRILRLTDQGSQAVDQVKPPKAELCRSGAHYGFGIANGATFVAPQTAIPALATAIQYFLFNNNPAGSGMCLVVDSLGFFLASGTAAVGASLMAGLSSQAQAVPAAFASGVIQNLRGKPNASLAILASAITMTGVAPAWVQVAADGSLTAAATIGQGLRGEVAGGIIIPPQYGMGIFVLSGTGTSALYGVTGTFDVLPLDLE